LSGLSQWNQLPVKGGREEETLLFGILSEDFADRLPYVLDIAPPERTKGICPDEAR
jgi:hypothetical protein